jgi:hypothetical protein
MSRATLLFAVMAVTATAGCSASPASAPSQAPPSSAAAPASSAPGSSGGASSANAPSASGSPVTPASSCLTGRYRLARFVGAGANATYGTGAGGDITVSFDKGRYALAGAGKKWMTLTLAGQRASLLVDGRTAGRYSGRGDQVTFTRGKSTGSASGTLGKQKQNLSMEQIANVLGPRGSAKLACTSTQLTITMTGVRLELDK